MSLIVKFKSESSNEKKSEFTIAEATAAFQAIRNDKRKISIQGIKYDLKSIRISEMEGIFLKPMGIETEDSISVADFMSAISNLGKTKTNFIIGGVKFDLSSFEFAISEESFDEDSDSDGHHAEEEEIEQIVSAANSDEATPLAETEEALSEKPAKAKPAKEKSKAKAKK